MNNPDDLTLRNLLAGVRTIAVVGLSNKPHRASYRVACYMQEQGYRIIPINPRLKEVLGEKAYPDLTSVPEPIDLVNVFRRSDDVPGVVEEALPLKPEAVWLQSGISHPGAAARVRESGLYMIMDCCLMVKHKELFKDTLNTHATP